MPLVETQNVFKYRSNRQKRQVIESNLRAICKRFEFCGAQAPRRFVCATASFIPRAPRHYFPCLPHFYLVLVSHPSCLCVLVLFIFLPLRVSFMTPSLSMHLFLIASNVSPFSARVAFSNRLLLSHQCLSASPRQNIIIHDTNNTTVYCNMRPCSLVHRC